MKKIIERLRKLANHELTGEIPEFEYSIAADEIQRMQDENSALRGILKIPTIDNDGTHAPWWVIVMPKQIMRPSINENARCIVGPFFSRESAENHLNSRRYEYGEQAGVYCPS